ncbi:cytochrome c oxidase subunit 7A2, mitochondrial [Hemibagrus wyckioides]|uniref:cytochrome c oxidase subunit 7A2, mitochondrial n=1 Tax=Hemibagrus wyckioides TaxID=337641 RepID=UPI00266C54FF|nr:cytochrome c oxidase subunit 7A2, mitochondrial [Hemibagrus wyckioides]
MMFRHIRTLRQVAARPFSNSACRQVENKVTAKQKLFQEDNGLPVHLKGGTVDSLLFSATMALTVFGTGYVIYELFKAAMPKKSE